MFNAKTIAILPTPEQIEVTVIGCGAVGSKAINELARLGVQKFHLYDFDKVEEKNLGNQAFARGDIGEFKVDACMRMIRDINQCSEVVKYPRKFTRTDEITTKYVVISVDSMAARADIYGSITDASAIAGSTVIGIDTRISTFEVSVYSFNTDKPDTLKEYERSLYPDSAVAPEFQSVCGVVQGLGTLSSLAGLMAVQKIIHSEKDLIRYGEDIMNIEKNFDIVCFTK